MGSGPVRVVNASRGAVLAERADVADTFWRRLRGLLGRSGLEPGEGLVLVPASSVHCIGMRFSIDVLHVDREGRLLRVVPDLKPQRLGPLVWRSHSVVELPAGTAAATGTQAGDLIELQPLPAAG